MASISSYVIRDVLGLDATATCREAADLMSKRHVGAVAVKQDGRIVGLITERDLVTRILSRGLDCQTPILEAMRRDVPVVGPELNEVECSALMKEHETRHLLVGEDGAASGLISMRDVMQMMLADKQFLIEQMQAYIQGY
jgi:CBS domain-containing protein